MADMMGNNSSLGIHMTPYTQVLLVVKHNNSNRNKMSLRDSFLWWPAILGYNPEDETTNVDTPEPLRQGISISRDDAQTAKSEQLLLWCWYWSNSLKNICLSGLSIASFQIFLSNILRDKKMWKRFAFIGHRPKDILTNSKYISAILFSNNCTIPMLVDVLIFTSLQRFVIIFFASHDTNLTYIETCYYADLYQQDHLFQSGCAVQWEHCMMNSMA